MPIQGGADKLQDIEDTNGDPCSATTLVVVSLS